MFQLPSSQKSFLQLLYKSQTGLGYSFLVAFVVACLGIGCGKTEPAINFQVSTLGKVASLTRYTGESMIVRIPSKIGGRKVVAIENCAFEGCSGIVILTIPSNVTKIGEDAFAYCAGLEDVKIPSSVTEIGKGAFEGCTGLTSVEIPSSVTEIGEDAFKGCTGLTSMEIPLSVTVIGKGAFRGCFGLVHVHMPKSFAYYNPKYNLELPVSCKIIFNK